MVFDISLFLTLWLAYFCLCSARSWMSVLSTFSSSGFLLIFWNLIYNLILQVYHTQKLADGQDITAVALNKDNTNLLVSTVDKQLIIFTDPTVSQNSSLILVLNSSLILVLSY